MSVMSLPRSLWTPFQEKSYELDLIKKRAYKLMGEFNSIILEYRDWFNRRHTTFINAIKIIQHEAPSLVPLEITCLNDLRNVVKVGRKLNRSGSFRFRGEEHFDQFFTFWDEFLKAKEYLDCDLMIEVEAFLSQIEALRQPELKADIDRLNAQLAERTSEKFKFEGVDREKNQFVFKMTMADRRFVGLMGFIPYILDFATKVCFLIGKLFIERIK